MVDLRPQRGLGMLGKAERPEQVDERIDGDDVAMTPGEHGEQHASPHGAQRRLALVADDRHGPRILIDVTLLRAVPARWKRHGGGHCHCRAQRDSQEEAMFDVDELIGSPRWPSARTSHAWP